MKAEAIGAAAAAVALAGLLAGCAGQAKQLQLRDGTGATQEVTFPKGRLLGGVSQEQIGAIAQMVADTNAATGQRLDGVEAGVGRTAAAAERIEDGTQRLEAAAGEIRASGQRVEETTRTVAEGNRRIEEATRGVSEATRRIDETTQRTGETAQRALETGERTYDTTRMVLEAFEKVSKKQGTGELTVFFPVASSRIPDGSLQHDRIVTFADFLSRESRGRTIRLVLVGSASAFGPPEVNERLARERCEAPVGIFDKYLVNVPHEYVKIYGTGDAYSPRGVSMKEHERYQACRVIAFYEKDQEPALPAEPTPATGPVSQR